MPAQRFNLIPETLVSSEAFLKDLRRFASTSPEVLTALAQASGRPSATPSESEIGEIARQAGQDSSVLYRVAAVLALLRSRAVGSDLDAADVIAEIRSALGDDQDITKGQEKELRKLFSFTAEMKEDALAERAFSFGTAYLSLAIRPCLLPLSNQDDRLFSGYIMRIDYLDSEREGRAVTFMLSPTELEEFKVQIDVATRQLSRVRDHSRGAVE